MKRIYKIICIIFLIAGLSCNKAIEIEPTHSATLENALKSITDVETSLSDVYINLRAVGYYGRDLSVMGDMMTDNLTEVGTSLANFREMTDWAYTSNNGTVSETWQACFLVINSANIIINNVDKFTTAANQTQANSIKGQAIAIRAMAHFDLLRLFADSYDRSATGLGIPYITASVLESSPVTFKPSRLTIKESYDKIYADIATAKTLLANVNASINSTSKRDKMDLIGVTALQARVALYAKDYPTAISNATTVINAMPLASKAVFPQIWKDGTITEVAFAVYNATGEGGSLAGDIYSGANDRLQFEGAAELFNQIDAVNDVRYASYVTKSFSSGVTAHANRLVPTKYLGKGTTVDGRVNFKAFRTGEMYLIRAEAYANTTGQEALGLLDLNALRAARINGFITGVETGAALTAAIALERRKELWLEGHRWFDLKRTSRTIARQNCGAPATACSLASTSAKWTWPIPQGETQANPNMQVNPGY
jgi:hypothetical protein